MSLDPPPCTISQVLGSLIEKPANHTFREKPVPVRREAETDSHFLVKLCELRDPPSPQLPSLHQRAQPCPGCAEPSPGYRERPRPLELMAWSASAGSLTDPEHLRGGLREDVAQEIEECPAGVPGPEPGLDEYCAALHLLSFLIHAETQSWPHARKMHPTWVGSPPHPPWML